MDDVLRRNPLFAALELERRTVAVIGPNVLSALGWDPYTLNQDDVDPMLPQVPGRGAVLRSLGHAPARRRGATGGGGLRRGERGRGCGSTSPLRIVSAMSVQMNR